MGWTCDGFISNVGYEERGVEVVLEDFGRTGRKDEVGGWDIDEEVHWDDTQEI